MSHKPIAAQFAPEGHIYKGSKPYSDSLILIPACTKTRVHVVFWRQTFKIF